MKRAVFKGYPVYIPDQLELDDVIVVVHNAACKADLQVQAWKDGDIDVGQVGKAGQYVIKWLNDEATIHILPDVIPYRVRHAPTEWNDLWEFKPVLAIKLCETDSYPAQEIGSIHSELPIPDEGYYYWDKEKELLIYVSDATYHLPQLHHTRHIKLEHVGDPWALYDTRYTEWHYDLVDAGIILAHEFAYRIWHDPFGHVFYLDPLIFNGTNEWGKDDGYSADPYHYTRMDRCWAFEQRYTNTIEDNGTVLQLSADGIRQECELEFVKNYKIPDDLINDLWPEEMREKCVYNPGTYRVYERKNWAVSTFGNEVWLEWGEVWDDPRGQHHRAYIWIEYDQGGSAWYYLTVDDKTWLLEAWPYDPYDPPDFYCECCDIYKYRGDMVVVFAYFTFPDKSQEKIKYGLVYKDKLHRCEFDNDKGWLNGNLNRHDIFELRAEKGLEGYGKCLAIAIEEFSETTYPGEINEEHLYFEDD